MLFPRTFKFIGWVLAIPGIALGVLFQANDYILPFLNYKGGRHRQIYKNAWENNLTDELAITLVVIGMLFIGFAKLKNESKHTGELRLRALYHAFIVSNIAASISLMIFFEACGFSPFPILQNYLPGVLIIFTLWFYYFYLRRKLPPTPFYFPYAPFNLIGKMLTGEAFLILIFAMVEIKYKQLGDIAEYVLLAGLLLWMSAKGKNESPAMATQRVRALQLSVYIGCGLFIAATWLFYELDYLLVLIVSIVLIQALYLIIFYSSRRFASRSSLQPISTQAL